MTSTNAEVPFSVLVYDDGAGNNIVLENIGSYGLSLCVSAGAVSAPMNTVTEIVTPVTDLSEATNLVDGVIGNDNETDSELRIRAERDIRVVGAASIDAIRGRLLQEVDGVTVVFVEENASAIVVNGLAPHSIHCVIAGGDDDAIAQKIWDTKAGGIYSNGSESGVAVDSEGNDHVIFFDRPVPIYAHAEVTIDEYNPEEDFPSDGKMHIKQDIADLGATFGIGKDIIMQKLFTPVYSVPGISQVLIRIAVTPNPGDTPTYGTVNIELATNEVSEWDISRVTILP